MANAVGGREHGMLRRIRRNRNGARWPSAAFGALPLWLCLLPASGQDIVRNDPQAGLVEWSRIESVLTHPRCLNCHTITAYPRQGDERHPHAVQVWRGPDGHGMARKCRACHSDSKNPFTGVPGALDWRMAPLSLAWESAPGKAAPSGVICATLRREGPDGILESERLIESAQFAPFVLWAWEPGKRRDGSPRSTPPMKHAEFVDALKRWISAGAPCPTSQPAAER